jgi:hypothetical protein
MTSDRLSDRALNRATLQRQLLLERAALDSTEAVAGLVGLQAQNPLDPYLALWSRLEGFDPQHLAAGLLDRSLVRIVVMRGTIHLMTAADALEVRPLTQPVLDAEIRRHQEFAPQLVGVDVQPVLDAAEPALADRSMTPAQLRTFMAERFPHLHAGALAYACRCYLALVQVPPRGVWGKTAQVTLAPLTSWVDAPLATQPSIDDLVLRYLRVFGPATVADAAAWSRLTRFGEVFERLGDRLRRFTDERGRVLYDLPDLDLPDPDTPAPPRFLPEYDNLLLSHADRARFAEPGLFMETTGPIKGSVLVDGKVRAIWRTERDANKYAVVVEHARLDTAERQALAEEADRLANFWLHAADQRDVRLMPLPIS